MQVESSKLVANAGADSLLARAKTKYREFGFSKLLGQSVAIAALDLYEWAFLMSDGTYVYFYQTSPTGPVNIDYLKASPVNSVVTALMQKKLVEKTDKQRLKSYGTYLDGRVKELTAANNDLRAELAKTLANASRDRFLLAETKDEVFKLRQQIVRLEEKLEPKTTSLKSVIRRLFFVLVCFFLLSCATAECSVKEEVNCVGIENIGIEDYLWSCKAGNLTTCNVNLNALFDECVGHYSKAFCENALEVNIKPQANFEFTFDLLHDWRIEKLAMFVISFALSRNPTLAVVQLCLTAATSWFGVKPLVLSFVLNYVTWEGLGIFLYVALIKRYVVETLTLFWVYATMKAVFVVDDTFVGTRVSLALLNVVFLYAACAINEILVVFEVPVVIQVAIICATATLSFGLKFAFSTVTVAHPDGTITKHRRLSPVAGTLVSFFQNKIVRGVIPAFPNKTSSIALVYATTSEGIRTGTCFRVANNLITAGHVVEGATKIEVEWKGLKTTTKLSGEYVPNDYTDRVSLLEVPQPFVSMPALKLAKEARSDYLALLAMDDNTKTEKVFSGWCTIDDNYVSAPFETYAGSSGAPMIDRTGRLVAMHFGSNIVVSAGYVVNTLLRSQPVKPQCEIDLVMSGVRNSHASLLTTMEQLAERVASLETAISALKRSTEHNSDAISFLLNADDLVIPQAKGKNKKYKAQKARKKFSKMKVLTEEEYKRLQDEGYTAEEIKGIVRQLRETAYLEWEAEQSSSSDEDFVVEPQAHMRFTTSDNSGSRKVVINMPPEKDSENLELFKQVVTNDDAGEGTSTVAAYLGDDGALYVEGKRLDFSKIPDIGGAEILKIQKTNVSGTPSKPEVVKDSETIFLQKTPDAEANGPQVQEAKKKFFRKKKDSKNAVKSHRF